MKKKLVVSPPKIRPRNAAGVDEVKHTFMLGIRSPIPNPPIANPTKTIAVDSEVRTRTFLVARGARHQKRPKQSGDSHTS
ncbi:MAG: hypothetical protein KME15_04420 [Drouetiella hepatica Uher 2000/2452]|uniref:Uncharacterized protein n=1 Tax=Drouetiella hepatica Uher 2000/2452 TaxID=904376 RepID=A0A951Q8L8_9CYAN|nr:hypothetical protein [Drouetiella hepatica Uher 2000/2452]